MFDSEVEYWNQGIIKEIPIEFLLTNIFRGASLWQASLAVIQSMLERLQVAARRNSLYQR